MYVDEKVEVRMQCEPNSDSVKQILALARVYSPLSIACGGWRRRLVMKHRCNDIWVVCLDLSADQVPKIFSCRVEVVKIVAMVAKRLLGEKSPGRSATVPAAVRKALKRSTPTTRKGSGVSSGTRWLPWSI